MTASRTRMTRLSKFLSLVLRHQPELAGLSPDEEGFVSLGDLLSALQRRPEHSDTTLEDIRAVVAGSDKQRFELREDRIRARYGHSIDSPISYPPAEPPEILYHGTSPEALPSIRETGLNPMKRQYVHCSTTTDQARRVGLRHSPKPVILVVQARRAFAAGVIFYQPEDRLFITKHVPKEFIEKGDGINSN